MPARPSAVVAPGRRPAATPRRSWARTYLPPQHGAWAMLLLPYLVGVLRSDATWVHLPLLLAWLAGYLGFYYASLALKTRRVARVRRQLLVYGAVTAPCAAVVLLARPQVALAAPAFAVLLATMAWFASRRQDRSVANDLTAVVLACLMVFVAALVGDAPPASLTGAFVAMLLYFAGTVLYVKTMIRERGEAAYLRASVAFHVVAVPVAALVSWWLAPLFAVLLARAAVLPGRALTPKQIGVGEVVASVALLVVLLVS